MLLLSMNKSRRHKLLSPHFTTPPFEGATILWHILHMQLLVCVGAVVFALIQAVEQGQASTYNTLLRAMRYSLKNGPQHFAKIPELSASWDFDLNRPFLL